MKQHITLSYRPFSNDYVVTKVVNRLDPKPGVGLTEKQVEELLREARIRKELNVEIFRERNV